ncbi:hypothetical protein [Helicobacter marmotae]|nr:hypothetical protein [Helicobacter marmotae]
MKNLCGRLAIRLEILRFAQNDEVISLAGGKVCHSEGVKRPKNLCKNH